MRIIQYPGTKVPVHAWVDYIEDEAEKQLKNVASLPGIFRHVAVMPDVHSGYGMPIGTVAALEGFVSPSMVGVDIGCGMAAGKTSLTVDQLPVDRLKKVMGRIRELIPVGFAHHQEKQTDFSRDQWAGPFTRTLLSEAAYQIGTLGGGNHFIELQKDAEGAVWVMVHSGSRNVGKKTADHYDQIAKERFDFGVPSSAKLALLPIDSSEGASYWEDMAFCLHFAEVNRLRMMSAILRALDEEFGQLVWWLDRFSIHHNYAALAIVDGTQVVVHRKGATAAADDQYGIIPGSQGTKSYIVRGKGNLDSFQSCSHGAGRRMSRSKAKQTLNLEAEIAAMDAKGIIHGIRHAKDLDEAASAYKNIDTVMALQSDLVDIVVELQPMAVIKG